MKIRITEPVFFLGEERKAGDVIDGVAVGPYRTELSSKGGVPGGLTRIAQFVEMPEEIKQASAAAANLHPTDAQSAQGSIAVGHIAPASFAEATAAVLKPASAVAPSKANPLAARIRALTTRRAKFQDMAASMLEAGEQQMTKIEAEAPGIFERAKRAAEDELSAVSDLGNSLQELAKANGGPLQD